MKMRILLCCAFAAALMGAGAANKGMLVLQVGSDWCESGDYVRQVFESSDFRLAVRRDFDFAVYDDMDKPTDAVRAANKKVAGLRVESRRFPSITFLSGDPRRFFAQLDNIPWDITAKDLAAQVQAMAKGLHDAEALFRKGASMRTGNASGAADAYGAAFEILVKQVGEPYQGQVFNGRFAFAKEWGELKKLDAGDKYGWRRRFEMGYGFDIVNKANKFREDGDFGGGAAYVAGLRGIPTEHLTVEQRQCIDFAEYALWRKTSSHSSSNKALLKSALEKGRDTVWGQCAMGYLMLSGEKLTSRERYRASMRERPKDSDKISGRDPQLAAIAQRLSHVSPRTEELTDAQKADIVRHALLRRMDDGWRELKTRPGSKKFIFAFFGDRVWMEDFLWSGKCDVRRSLLALETLYFQDNGRWITDADGPGRRFATAVALEVPGWSDEMLADYLAAYRETAQAKRLHKYALTQPVWQWRFAVQSYDGESTVADAPNQQRYMEKFMNVRMDRYGGAFWSVPYRKYNCFGECIHTKYYYEPWATAGEWPKRRYSHIVGGVCGELSTFGSICGNSHGLPQTTVGQPGHCAYTRRRANGTWQICNNISPPTGLRTTLWPGKHSWLYLQAHEGTFEGDRERRLNAERFVELALMAEGRKASPTVVTGFFRRACLSWRTNYNAWREYGAWIARNERPIAEHRIFAMGCAKALHNWRQPMWDILTPYFERVAKLKGPKALTETLVEFAPLLRQSDERLQEEGDFKSVIAKWAKPLEGKPDNMEAVAKAVLEAQENTRDYHAQALTWCGEFVVADKKRLERFASLFGGKAGSGGRDVSRLILAASKSENFPAFRNLCALQEKLSPYKAKGREYPQRDFGSGTLVSSEGMLTTSSTSPQDTPAKYVHAIDATPCNGDSFVTASKEKEPWALVTLKGTVVLKGVVVENKGRNADQRKRQAPIEIEASDDGKTWRPVYSDEEARETYRADLSRSEMRVRYVRVRRKSAKDNEEPFRLSKILVYGRKLY